jgi:hypothetical protein
MTPEQHSEQVKAQQSAARRAAKGPAPRKANIAADEVAERKATLAKVQLVGPTPHEEVEVTPDPKAVTAALAEAKPTKARATKAAPAKPAANKAGPTAQDKVSGEQVRAYMKGNDLSSKDLAAIGGFSLSRVSELTKVSDLPASWAGRDRHATVTQWGAIVKSAETFIASRDKAAARKAAKS